MKLADRWRYINCNAHTTATKLKLLTSNLLNRNLVINHNIGYYLRQSNLTH